MTQLTTNATYRPDPDDVVRSFKSDDCPTFGGFKQKNFPLCRECYHAVPGAVKDELTTTGRRYEMALMSAAKSLNTELRIAERAE